ncbi:MAG: tRNA (cytidine(34)-2'-O)-methyltransferase [Deinococcales bacterium]
MLHIALFEPEIAANTGNIARSCVATGARLHLIRPLGFRLDESSLKRAGMDYWHEVDVELHDSFPAFYKAFQDNFGRMRVFNFSTKSKTNYSYVKYQDGDVLLFGPESRGLPENIRTLSSSVRIPMKGESRSLNLSVSVAIALYEAWRQLDFKL